MPLKGDRKRILLVDDDEGMRQMLDALLDKEGFAVQGVGDGEDALTIAEEMAPDLIVMDLMLPGLAGLEVIRRLQAGALAKVPVIVITGRFTDPSTSDMILQESNVADFFQKPLNHSKFALKLHNILGTGK